MTNAMDLNISIIGSGMGGLAAALSFAKKGFKHIDVYEHARDLGFVGAGIQIAPNLIRVLDRLGCWKDSEVQQKGTSLEEVIIVDGITEKELARTDMSGVEALYGYPHYTGHRAALAGTLYEAAKKEPSIHFHLGERLTDIKSFAPDKVIFEVQKREGGSRLIKTDVLIGADGIKSTARIALLNALNLEGEVENTGQAVYRILLTREQMSPYPELLKLLDNKAAQRWIGEKRFLIAYPVDNHQIYNVATCQPDTNFAGPTDSTWTTKGSKEVMLSMYDDFCPTAKKLLNLVPDGELVEWCLRSHTPLPRWTHGGVALLGDACHPTLPHLSQGAAMAIEDGATLAEVLSSIPEGKVDSVAIGKALEVYHLLRKDRTKTLVDLAAYSGKVLHLGEGKAKEERDRLFAEAKKSGEGNPDKWASPDVQKMIYEYDCVIEAQKKFARLYASL